MAEKMINSKPRRDLNNIINQLAMEWSCLSEVKREWQNKVITTGKFCNTTIQMPLSQVIMVI